MKNKLTLNLDYNTNMTKSGFATLATTFYVVIFNIFQAGKTTSQSFSRILVTMFIGVVGGI